MRRYLHMAITGLSLFNVAVAVYTTVETRHTRELMHRHIYFVKGVYPEACAAARKDTQAESVILIVADGKKGSGFSFEGNALALVPIPSMLRRVADEIDEPKGTVAMSK